MTENDSYLIQLASRSASCMKESYYIEKLRPFYLVKPEFMGIDGNMYWFLYGNNLQEGCAGFGASMDEASRDFDLNWSKKLTDAGCKK